MNNQMHGKAIMAGIMLAMLLLFSAVPPATVFAGSNVPVKLDITVTYIVEGNEETAGGDSFMLTADEPDTPMPEGTIDGKKEITIRDEGCYSFGDIVYERPDVYWYTITRDVTEKKGVVKDDSIYRAKVITLNDGHGYVLVYREGSEEKHELVYKDRVAPATGDHNSLIFYSGIAFAAAAAFTFLTAARRRDKKGDMQYEQEKNVR